MDRRGTNLRASLSDKMLWPVRNDVESVCDAENLGSYMVHSYPRPKSAETI